MHNLLGELVDNKKKNDIYFPIKLDGIKKRVSQNYCETPLLYRLSIINLLGCKHFLPCRKPVSSRSKHVADQCKHVRLGCKSFDHGKIPMDKASENRMASSKQVHIRQRPIGRRHRLHIPPRGYS